MPAVSRMVDNRKYMWDGATYATEADAARAAETYRASGFDVQISTEEGTYVVFTRREAIADPSKS